MIHIPSPYPLESIHTQTSHSDCPSKAENSIPLPFKIVTITTRLRGTHSNCKQNITLDQRGRSSDWSWVWPFLSTSAEDYLFSPIWPLLRQRTAHNVSPNARLRTVTKRKPEEMSWPNPQITFSVCETIKLHILRSLFLFAHEMTEECLWPPAGEGSSFFWTLNYPCEDYELGCSILFWPVCFWASTESQR